MNILILVLDAARRDRFGCFGYPRGTTPAIDDLATEGLLFERMISPAPWTLPSHASLFTGLYPRENGTHRMKFALKPAQVTLAQHLQHHGYATAFVSNNPLISQRTGFVDEGSLAVDRRQLYGDSRGSLTRTWARRLKVALGQMDKGAASANRAVVRLFRRLREPFFIFVNYMECHWAYTPTRLYERRFVRRRYSFVEAALRRAHMRRHHAWEPQAVRNDEELFLVRDLYDGAVAYLDSRVGELLEALDQSGQAGRTIVIVMSDHGESVGDYGWIGHGKELYDVLVRIPFVARIPGQAAGRVDGLVQTTDLFAGLCRTLGLKVPDQVRDRPYAVDPFGLRPGERGREFAFGEYHPMVDKQVKRRQKLVPDFRSSPALEMVQDARFKLVVQPESGMQRLFDLEADPQERRVLTNEQPASRARLLGALEQWRTLFPAVDAPSTYSAEEERAMNARLEELGYL